MDICKGKMIHNFPSGWDCKSRIGETVKAIPKHYRQYACFAWLCVKEGEKWKPAALKRLSKLFHQACTALS